MKTQRKQHSLALALTIYFVCVIFTPASYATLQSIDCWSCESLSSCKGRFVITSDSAPRPKGCTKSGANCAGNCYRCKNKTAYGFCVYTGKDGDSCEWDTRDKWLICGDEYKYDCEGVWDQNCTCKSTGGEDTGENCSIIKC